MLMSLQIFTETPHNAYEMSVWTAHQLMIHYRLNCVFLFELLFVECDASSICACIPLIHCTRLWIQGHIERLWLCDGQQLLTCCWCRWFSLFFNRFSWDRLLNENNAMITHSIFSFECIGLCLAVRVSAHLNKQFMEPSDKSLNQQNCCR